MRESMHLGEGSPGDSSAEGLWLWDLQEEW